MSSEELFAAAAAAVVVVVAAGISGCDLGVGADDGAFNNRLVDVVVERSATKLERLFVDVVGFVELLSRVAR